MLCQFEPVNPGTPAYQRPGPAADKVSSKFERSYQRVMNMYARFVTDEDVHCWRARSAYGVRQCG